MASSRHERSKWRPALLLFVLLPAGTFAATSIRAKPVVMPFYSAYGKGGHGGWYSIPVGVGGATYNLSISTTLSRSWVVGSSICEEESNKTACTLSRGGTYDPSKSTSWNADPAKKDVKMTAELKSAIYTDVKVEDESKDVLGIKGAGAIGTEKLTLKSKTGTFDLEKQSIGVFESEAPAFNGFMSLQQMALGLYAAGNTASPTVHVLHGAAAGSVYAASVIPDLSYGTMALIFGGYDKTIFDLNQTQQYPIRTTTLKKRDETPLPASETTGYKLQLDIDRVIYRWTYGGDTDNDILAKPTKAIIDTSTPYVWLPPKAMDTLLSVTGASWNATLNAYSMRYCFSDCKPAEETTMDAVLDFVFPKQTIMLSFRDYFKLEPLLDATVLITTGWKILPIRKLESEDSPIILGRAAMAGTHLWIDYADRYFGLARHNNSKLTQADIFSWSRTDHPPITNTSILAEKLSDAPDSKSSDSSSGTGDDKESESKSKMPAIIGAAVGGIAVVVIALAAFFLIRRHRQARHRRPIPPPATDPSFGRHELHNDSNYAAAEEIKPPYYQLDDTPAHSTQGYPPPTLQPGLTGSSAPVSPLTGYSLSPQPNVAVHHSGGSGWGYPPPGPSQFVHEVPGSAPNFGGQAPLAPGQSAAEMPANSWDKSMR